jgi:D-sedoheptulose 7-phosphate isomerase
MAALEEASAVLAGLAAMEQKVALAAQWCVGALERGNKILVCGNGGSAAEAHHLVGKLMGRCKRNRRALAAVAVHADPTLMTCIGYDLPFEDAFARQVEGLGRAGDLLIVFTTSDNSPKILRAMTAARAMQIQTIAFLGRDGGAALSQADCPLLVAHSDTARIQEGHNILMHLMDGIEAQSEPL